MLRLSAFALAVVLIGCVVGWAGATVLTPPRDVLEPGGFALVEVKEGEVSSSLTVNAVAQWAQLPVGLNQAQGVITSIDITPGQEVDQGGVLYTTNLRATVAAKGAVPAFRSLQLGDMGPDVAQVQEMLAVLGFYSGPADSTFRRQTSNAVRAWQRSLGITADGVVRLGDVIFVPQLPARVVLDNEVAKVGAVLVGGESMVKVMTDAPAFALPATDAQAAHLAQGARVEIRAPRGGIWEAQASSWESEADGQITVHLVGLEGQPICGEECDSLAIEGSTVLSARVILVEATRGLVVPTAAILSASDGALSVVDAAGKEHPIAILATARGMSIIEGVAAGIHVRLPATDS